MIRHDENGMGHIRHGLCLTVFRAYFFLRRYARKNYLLGLKTDTFLAHYSYRAHLYMILFLSLHFIL